ncbi:MAG: TIGR02186 family protein, partial [Pseudomonadota bacterium]
DIHTAPSGGALLATLPAPGAAGQIGRYIYATRLRAGLGSNPVGLDRGAGLEGDEDVTIGRYDIVVVIEGPREPSVVRKKARTAGIWINRDTVEFDSVPASYLMMTTKPVDDPQFQQALSSLGIGLSEITFNTNSANADAATDGDFRDAVVRLKMTKELYWEGEGIRFLGDNLFRARFKIPALVPIGVHQVRSYLLLDNQLVSGATQAVNIKKTGFEQFLYRFAHDYGFLYGVVCVILAILTGWLSSVIFRRD